MYSVFPGPTDLLLGLSEVAAVQDRVNQGLAVQDSGQFGPGHGEQFSRRGQHVRQKPGLAAVVIEYPVYGAGIYRLVVFHRRRI